MKGGKETKPAEKMKGSQEAKVANQSVKENSEERST